MEEQQDEKVATKRKRDAADAGPQPDGAEEKAKAGQEVPKLPVTEGGAPDTKQAKVSNPKNAAHLHDELLRLLDRNIACLTRRDQAAQRLEDLLRLANDLCKCGGPIMKKVAKDLDLEGKLIIEDRDGRMETCKKIWDRVPDFLLFMGQWEFLTYGLLERMDINAHDPDRSLSHPSLPECDHFHWVKILQRILQALYGLTRVYENAPTEEPEFIATKEAC